MVDGNPLIGWFGVWNRFEVRDELVKGPLKFLLEVLVIYVK